MASPSSGVDLSNIPLSKPPPGEVTDFVNAESISWAGRLSIYLTLPIMVIAFALRMYVRIQKRQFGIDDLLLVFGVAAAISFCGVLLPVFLNDVLGRHAWNIPVSAIHPWFFQYSTTAGCLYNASALFTKISILTLYFYIFSPSRRARTFIWFGIISILVSYLALTACLLYYLLPHIGDGGWGSPANTRREGDPSRIIDFTQGVFSAVSDYYVLAIPISVVAQLQSPLKRKIGVSYLAGPLRQAVAELNVGILCACIPVFFVLFKGVVKRTESSFLYLRGHLSPHGSRKGHNVDAAQNPQPKIMGLVPGGTLTGLRSIFRKAGRTQNQGTEKALTDASGPEFLELQSIDYDYHAQLRRGSRTASTRSLIEPMSHV
ncbi:hypothetical protein EKO27_g8182 [Xylaria grammica]|uniref:Rhodopsin domain-containing protein n=1 Tax=Xylaria grammica TaxID=363999 RepID=A0A439CY35_9PEZI|nr:hypothetical protein EKO27_g8182 [Xylaria grammica]